jgi:Tfp pilus assembly protein FimT
MVVLAIMTLMAACLPLALNRMLPGRRVVVAADALVADIHWLQLRATETGRPATLKLTKSGYRLEPEAPRAPRIVSFASSTTLQLRRRDDNRTVDELTVYPDGTSAAGRFELLDSGRSAAVEISMLTGRARRLVARG